MIIYISPNAHVPIPEDDAEDGQTVSRHDPDVHLLSFTKQCTWFSEVAVSVDMLISVTKFLLYVLTNWRCLIFLHFPI